MGVIDTLNAGFRLVALKPAAMLIPLALNLFLWLGPRLSIQPAVAQLVQWLARWNEMLAQMGAGEANTALLASSIEQLRNSGIEQLNLFSALVWGNLGMPSIASLSIAESGNRVVLYVQEFWQVIPVSLLLAALGLLITAAFLSVLGYLVRGEPLALNRLAGWTAATWVRLIAVLIPVGLVMLATVFASVLFGPLALIPILGVVWMLLYISFFPQAIALAGHHPLGAVLSSAQIVRLNLWATVRLLLVVFVLSAGLGLIWQRLVTHSTVGALVALGAGSYVGTALTAALFVFYRDRVILLHEMIQRQRSAQSS